jgi:polyisoprenoid-binding protein YceI
MTEPSVAAATRIVLDHEIPVAGTWAIDPAHQDFAFLARHLMVTRVRGSFTEVSGTIELAEDPTESTVEIILQAASVDTGNPERDEHLRSPDFFDVATYPEIRFRSTSIQPDEDRWTVTGDLAVRDAIHPVTLTVEFLGVAIDPWGNPKAGFSASGELNREDWGLTWNVPLETGGVLVSKMIQLDIEAQLKPAD